MQNIFQKPIAQKILLVVLLSGIATVIYVSAATNIGTNISTDGTLSVTGTTTLSSALNINDINVALSNSGDIGLNITGSTGTGIQSARPIRITGDGNNSFIEFTADDDNYNNNNGILYFGSDIVNGIGIGMDGIDNSGVGIWQYLGNWTGKSGTGIYQVFQNNGTAGNEGVGLDIAMSTRNDLNKGINITGSTGIGIQSTRPLQIITPNGIGGGYTSIEIEDVVGAGTGISSGEQYGIHIGGAYNDGIGIRIDGVWASASAGRGIQIDNINNDGTVGIYLSDIDGNNGGLGSWGILANLTHSEATALEITGTTGTGIKTTRPIKLFDASPADNYDGALHIQEGQNNGVMIGLEPLVGTGEKVYGINWWGGGSATSSVVIYSEQLDAKGIHFDMRGTASRGVELVMNNASQIGIDISGTAGTGIKTTRPYIGVTTDTATSTAITFETSVPLTNTLAKMVSFNNATSTKSFIDVRGGYWVGDAQDIWGVYGDGYTIGSFRNIANGDPNYNGITAGVYTDNSWQNYSYFDSYGDNTRWAYWQEYRNNLNFSIINSQTTANGVTVQYNDNAAGLHNVLTINAGSGNPQIFNLNSLGQLSVFGRTNGYTLWATNPTATSTIIFGDDVFAGNNGACLKLRDSDDGGWTYCSVLDGSLTCSTSSCE